MPRPVHFEIHASDPAASKAFYETLFGWRLDKWGDAPYWIVITGDGDPMAGKPHSTPGIDGGLMPRQGGPPSEGQPVNSFVVTLDVPDCDGYVERVVAAGGSVALAAQDMAGVGRVAYVKDPDGNLFGLFQPGDGAGEQTGQQAEQPAQ
jgi:predicted enzyme related to lactoylglutathione lyase